MYIYVVPKSTSRLEGQRSRGYLIFSSKGGTLSEVESVAMVTQIVATRCGVTRDYCPSEVICTIDTEVKFYLLPMSVPVDTNLFTGLQLFC